MIIKILFFVIAVLVTYFFSFLKKKINGEDIRFEKFGCFLKNKTGEEWIKLVRWPLWGLALLALIIIILSKIVGWFPSSIQWPYYYSPKHSPEVVIDNNEIKTSDTPANNSEEKPAATQKQESLNALPSTSDPEPKLISNSNDGESVVRPQKAVNNTRSIALSDKKASKSSVPDEPRSSSTTSSDTNSIEQTATKRNFLPDIPTPTTLPASFLPSTSHQKEQAPVNILSSDKEAKQLQSLANSPQLTIPSEIERFTIDFLNDKGHDDHVNRHLGRYVSKSLLAHRQQKNRDVEFNGYYFDEVWVTSYSAPFVSAKAINNIASPPRARNVVLKLGIEDSRIIVIPRYPEKIDWGSEVVYIPPYWEISDWVPLQKIDKEQREAIVRQNDNESVVRPQKAVNDTQSTVLSDTKASISCVPDDPKSSSAITSNTNSIEPTATKRNFLPDIPTPTTLPASSLPSTSHQKEQAPVNILSSDKEAKPNTAQLGMYNNPAPFSGVEVKPYSGCFEDALRQLGFKAPQGTRGQILSEKQTTLRSGELIYMAHGDIGSYFRLSQELYVQRAIIGFGDNQHALYRHGQNNWFVRIKDSNAKVDANDQVINILDKRYRLNP